VERALPSQGPIPGHFFSGEGAAGVSCFVDFVMPSVFVKNREQIFFFFPCQGADVQAGMYSGYPP
jgi:hypothetical protein